jgi:hypothetical protein
MGAAECRERFGVRDPRPERDRCAVCSRGDLGDARADSLVVEQTRSAEIDAQVGRPDECDVESPKQLVERIDRRGRLDLSGEQRSALAALEIGRERYRTVVGRRVREADTPRSVGRITRSRDEVVSLAARAQ